jgi:hypothetical protein
MHLRPAHSGRIPPRRVGPAHVKRRAVRNLLPPSTQARSRLTLREAEGLLDWLEANGCGCRDRALDYETGRGFRVHWHGPHPRAQAVSPVR